MINFNGYLNYFFPSYLFKGGFKDIVKTDEFLNNYEFLNTVMNLINRRLDSFKWSGLPKSCSERYLEAILLFNGKVACYKTEEGTLLMLPCVLGPEYNVNGEFLECTVYSANNEVFEHATVYQPGIKEYEILSEGIMKKVSTNYDCVVGYENASMYPYILEILTKAKQISNRERAIDVAVESMKQPLIITAPEEQVKSILEKFRKVRNNEPIILEYNPLQKDSKAEVLQTGVNAEFIKILREDLNCVKDWESELAGFNSNPSHKRERNTVDEVNANNELIDANQDRGLLWRKKFCEDVNTAFGLNLGVEFRYKHEEMNSLLDDNKEDDDNEYEYEYDTNENL